MEQDPLRVPSIRRRMRPQHPAKVRDEGELAPAPKEARVDTVFKDLDKVFKTIHDYVPTIDSEMIFRRELDKSIRVHAFLMFIGFLMVSAVLLYSVNLS